MKNKLLRKVLVYGVSVAIVAGVVGGIVAFKGAKEQAELEASYVDPIPVMTQEEMEELYDQNKKDGIETETIEEVVEETEAETWYNPRRFQTRPRHGMLWE